VCSTLSWCYIAQHCIDTFTGRRIIIIIIPVVRIRTELLVQLPQFLMNYPPVDRLLRPPLQLMLLKESQRHIRELFGRSFYFADERDY